MMEAVETLQRRPEGPGSLGGRPAEAPSVPEGQAIAPKLRVKPGGETSLSIGLQVAAPFMCADLGLPMAGVLLDCLQANTGVMDPKEQHKIINSNLALVQVHAIIVGLLAALAALLLGAVSREELDLVEMGLLCASSVITAFLAAFTLGTLMVCIVIGARKLGVNPDNIVTPIAASLGDLITQSILALVSSFFYKHKGVGGNLVAIQTSQISTHLHICGTPGVLPLLMKRFWPNPCSLFCASGRSCVFQGYVAISLSEQKLKSPDSAVCGQ
ncbi:solute carrier family 41 member 3-like isoform X1 [Tamandua tetradactyla]|uniref:solute carrier family 41 member 3-like isoform X1 n=1 Tax=Tamandua tetradactyla TaxID=48850 RepID=UPI0040545079